VRTIQTITPFAESSGLPIETMIEFKETAHGKFANTAQSDDQKNDRIKIWEDHDYKFGETGESVNDLKARAQKVIEYITQKYP
jgi:broad specificity phosphatase PhoE